MRKIYRNLLSVPMLLVLVLLANTSFAQSHTVTGKVSDGEGLSLPGVNVLIKGTTVGTATDGEGKFSLEASAEDVLVVSFIGYQTEEITVGSQTNITVTLIEDIQSLEEIVVVGYGTQKKSDISGAVASIGGDKLRGTITANVDQALQGRIAGVQVTQNSGQPGGAVSIRIRGSSSITGSNEPLYVIDGIQFQGDAGEVAGFDWFDGSGGQKEITNPLAAINPNDIESIDVLKDASATAIYGSRGANGVVIITTKRGKPGDAKISYNGFYSLQQVPKTLDMMNLPEYAAYQYSIGNEIPTINVDQRFADPSLLGPGTDWQDAVFEIAPMQSHQISVSGGTDKTQYALSGGYFSQDGIVVGSGFQRFSSRLNLDSKIKDWFKAGTSISFSRTDETITLSDGGDGVVSQALQMPPSIPVYNFDGTYAGPGNGSAEIRSNPVALALLRNNTVARERIMANFFGDISIVKGLTFRSEYGIDNGHALNKAFVPTYEWGAIVNPTNQLRHRQDNNFFWIWKNYFSYNYELSQHNINATLGTEAQRSDYEFSSIGKINLASNDIQTLNQGEINSIDGGKGAASLASYYARVNYNFADKYFITGTIRADGSSKFGPNNRWGYFPSGNIAWKVTNESFMPTSNVVTDLKIRAGFGRVGNQAIPDFAYGSSLKSITNTSFGTAYINNRISNPDLKWESSVQYNAGLDMSFWNGRIDLTVDLYKKFSDGLLLKTVVPNYYGSGDETVEPPYANVGNIENEGIEVMVTSHNISSDRFSWNTDVTFSLNRNEVKEIDRPYVEGLYWYAGFQNVTRTTAGGALGLFYGYETEGVFVSEEDILNHAVQVVEEEGDEVNFIDQREGLWLGDIKFKDRNGDGFITSDDRTVIGNPNPDFTFGLNNTFSYGPFTMNLYLVGSYGFDIFNYQRARNEGMDSQYNNQAASVANRASFEIIDPNGDRNDINNYEMLNPNATIPRFSQLDVNGNEQMSDRWIEDGSYVRVQNLSLSYNIPSSIAQKIKANNLKVNVNVQNLYTFTNYSGYDPEIGSFNQNPLRQNLDMGRIPAPRVYTVGLDLNF